MWHLRTLHALLYLYFPFSASMHLCGIYCERNCWHRPVRLIKFTNSFQLQNKHCNAPHTCFYSDYISLMKIRADELVPHIDMTFEILLYMNDPFNYLVKSRVLWDIVSNNKASLRRHELLFRLNTCMYECILSSAGRTFTDMVSEVIAETK